MRLSLASAIMLSAGPVWAEVGVSRQAECSLVIEGKEWIAGQCSFDPFDAEGSFTITGADGKTFAYVLVDASGNALGYWNGPAFGSHAHDPLGELTRQDACWINETASVCAW